jgi:hypothetical protein
MYSGGGADAAARVAQSLAHTCAATARSTRLAGASFRPTAPS